MNKISVTFIIFIVLIIGVILYFREGELPMNKNNASTKVFIIKPGETVADIAKNLENQNLIRSKVVFYWTVKRLGIDNKIQAGDFRLSGSMTAEEIAKNLTKGTLDVWVTIQEGLRKEEVAQIISQKFNIPEIEFTEQAKEGYLYPDTYLIPTQANVNSILDILQKNFDQKLTPELKQKALEKGLTINQVVTLASLVEREAFVDDTQGVANILYKRYKEGYPLQVDATVQYALGYQVNEKRWWKKELSLDDLKINSDYNTYKNTGLPPGPISSPSIDAMKAVINANENTPYIYYLHDSKGQIHYGRTLEEHQENIKKYL